MARPAYTTAEGLMVVSIIAILSAVIVIAVTADKRLVDTRNTERKSEVATILSSVTRYAIDHDGIIPETILSEPREICRSDALDCTGLVDLSALTLNSTYLDLLPIDPQTTSANGTGYVISRIGANRLHVDAPLAEWGVVISKSQ